MGRYSVAYYYASDDSWKMMTTTNLVSSFFDGDATPSSCLVLVPPVESSRNDDMDTKMKNIHCCSPLLLSCVCCSWIVFFFPSGASGRMDDVAMARSVKSLFFFPSPSSSAVSRSLRSISSRSSVSRKPNGEKKEKKNLCSNLFSPC